MSRGLILDLIPVIPLGRDRGDKGSPHVELVGSRPDCRNGLIHWHRHGFITRPCHLACGAAQQNSLVGERFRKVPARRSERRLLMGRLRRYCPTGRDTHKLILRHIGHTVLHPHINRGQCRMTIWRGSLRSRYPQCDLLRRVAHDPQQEIARHFIAASGQQPLHLLFQLVA